MAQRSRLLVLGVATIALVAVMLTKVTAEAPRTIAGVAVVRVIDRPPAGGDGLPFVELAWLDERGARHPVATGDVPYTGGIAFQSSVLAVDADGDLWRIATSGARLRVGRGVVDGPVASPDGRLVGWFAGRLGEPSELWTWDGQATRRIARGLAGSAGLRFSPDGAAIAFVSARNGGIAGLWITPHTPNAARCLTNCSLRVEQDWRPLQRPLPDLDTLVFGNATLRFVGVDGSAQEVAR